MPQEEICRNRIISENYRDFIVNQLRGNIFDSISSEELCEQSMEYLYKTIYVDGTMADPINFEKYTYNSVPKCFTLIDTEALSQSGILQIQNYPTLGLKGNGVLVGFIDTGIDYENPVFRNIDGSTRILGIWDQSIQDGQPPQNFLYGTEYTKEMIDAAHALGSYALVDGAQAIQHIPVDVRALDCDFFAFSGHKVYGPTGVGVLYGKRSLLEQMPPWQGGGEMIKEVRFEKTTYNELPFKFEAGTPDFIGVVGLGEALEYVKSIGLQEIAEYEHGLMDYAMKQVREVPGIILYGDAANKSSVISFGIEGIHPFDLGTLLDKMGIAIRTGQLCAEPVMQHYGVQGMARASIAMYNTREEIDVFCEGLRKIEKIFKL